MTEYFRVLKKRPDVNFESKTWQAKGVIKSQRQKWVGMFQSQCHPVAYPFLHIPLTHVPLSLSYGTPGQLSLTLDPDHHSGYDSMPCFAYNHRATMIISFCFTWSQIWSVPCSLSFQSSLSYLRIKPHTFTLANQALYDAHQTYLFHLQTLHPFSWASCPGSCFLSQYWREKCNRDICLAPHS